MSIVRFCLMAVLSGTLMGCAPTLYHQMFGTDSMNVPLNHGGSVRLFNEAAKEVVKNGKHPRFSTGCYSACALFADRTRPNACVTIGAYFAYHQMTISMAVIPNTYYYEKRDEPPSSQDISAWVRARGGFPLYGFLFMYYPDTLLFWPLCK